MAIRRLGTLLAACALGLGAGVATAGEAPPRHGFAVLGTLKYPPGFRHFDYVNPDAPKGGRVTEWFNGSFDSLNPFILKGEPAAGSNPFRPGGSLITFQSLMVQSADEPDSYYGLIAESVELADDRRQITFNLRPEARFHDGSEITAHDVAYSFDTLKTKGHPFFRIRLADVTEAQVLGPRRIRFVFREGALTRDLPGEVAGLPILSRAWYETQPFEEGSLKPPLASGPYRVESVNEPRSITYARVQGHWAQDLPVYRGRFNFDRLRWEYYRDREVALEAFFAGKVDFREEFTSRDWATKYDVPPVRDGRIKRETLPDESPSGTQAFMLNTRRPQLADRRVREALAYAFDFEWTNKNLFYSLYERTTSIFENADLAAKGPPSAAELALLEPYRDRLPAEVLERAYVPPSTDGSGNIRGNLRTAQRLLQEAGWRIAGGRLVNADGRPFTLEFLSALKGFERIIMAYIRNLERLGIEASFRLMEPAQYENRRQLFDFDIITWRFGGELTPGIGLRNLWGSEAADVDGSFNFVGLKDPVVDALVERMIAAETRPDLITAARALDRVIMWGHYLVPQWFKASHTIAYWDMFGRPAVKPRYALGFRDTWWIDPARAAALEARR